jgi:tripartite-type tricarboxylate transporter receptor subunit TctC
MKLPRRQFLHLAAGAAAVPAAYRIARAQAYPSRPVHIIVGFAPGGGIDIMARLIGSSLSNRLGQQVVVENRPGAGTNIATEAVVRAHADGYTLLLACLPNAVNATLYDNLKFNFLRDITPVASIARDAFLVVVNPAVPATTLLEFIAYALCSPQAEDNTLPRGSCVVHHSEVPPTSPWGLLTLQDRQERGHP